MNLENILENILKIFCGVIGLTFWFRIFYLNFKYNFKHRK